MCVIHSPSSVSARWLPPCIFSYPEEQLGIFKRTYKGRYFFYSEHCGPTLLKVFNVSCLILLRTFSQCMKADRAPKSDVWHFEIEWLDSYRVIGLCQMPLSVPPLWHRLSLLSVKTLFFFSLLQFLLPILWCHCTVWKGSYHWWGLGM